MGLSWCLACLQKAAQEEEGGGAGPSGSTAAAEGQGQQPAAAAEKKQRVLRTYGQIKAKADPVTSAEAPMPSEGLLRLIAGSKKGRQKA